jgi:hypothetical protein
MHGIPGLYFEGQNRRFPHGRQFASVYPSRRIAATLDTAAKPQFDARRKPHFSADTLDISAFSAERHLSPKWTVLWI